MTPLLGFPCCGRDGARGRAILSCGGQSAWERRGRQPDGKPAGLARSPLYDAAELDGMEEKVEGLFSGAHVEGRSTTVRAGQAGEAYELEGAVVNGQQRVWLSRQDENLIKERGRSADVGWGGVDDGDGEGGVDVE